MPDQPCIDPRVTPNVPKFVLECPARLTRIEQEISHIKEFISDERELGDGLKKIIVGNGQLGLAAKVNILWHGYAWIIGLTGTVVGTGIGMALNQIFGK